MEFDTNTKMIYEQ